MSSEAPETWTICLVGGTGPEGRGLALRLAMAGHHVIVGSRSRDRASAIVTELRAAATTSGNLRGDANEAAASEADLTVLTIPYSGIAATLPGLAEGTRGKVVISAISPVEFRDGRPVALRPQAGSAAQEVAGFLPDARIVSAFQTVDAHSLLQPETPLDTDVVVCSDDAEARRLVIRLVNGIQGVRALSGGRLAASRYVEECTALLITLNRIYKSHSGIRFTGVDR